MLHLCIYIHKYIHTICMCMQAARGAFSLKCASSVRFPLPVARSAIVCLSVRACLCLCPACKFVSCVPLQTRKGGIYVCVYIRGVCLWRMCACICLSVRACLRLCPACTCPLLRSESSVVERNHSFHIPRNFLQFSTRMALFF
jgi:hypothetical protein